MGYFDYPLDTKVLQRKKIAIKKKLMSDGSSRIEKRVAVLGGSTTNEIVDQMELFLLYNGIKAVFYQSEFGLYWEDAMFGNQELDTFHPDIVYIHTNWRNISQFPDVDNTVDEIEELLETEYHRYKSMWENIKKKFDCPIVQNNFERSNYRILGNRDVWDCRGRSNFISKMNQKLYEYASTHDAFYINDIDYLASEYGLEKWNNSLYWNMYKYACPLNAIPFIAQSVANIIKSLYGKNKKILVLDLDNTIWGGVIGDDGVEGIKIGVENPSGQSYFEFQTYVKHLQKVGVILAVNSKNDMKNALAGLEHPDGVLKRDDFVSIKANWKTKDENLKVMADELSIGLDSFVFADDNPAEREIVKVQLPMVEVPLMNGAENYIKALDRSGYFEVTTLSKEDLNKTESYRARSDAMNAKAQFTNYNEYLKSLQMKADIVGFESLFIQRIAQLTNKSNQFNLTTLRCSETDIQDMQKSPAYICLCARLIDKFADNGVVTVVAGEIQKDELHIRLWLMSCRVLKRGLEDLMMNVLVEKACNKGIKTIYGYYYPTAKNAMVRDFYTGFGYHLLEEDSQGNVVYKLSVDQYLSKESQIKVRMD